jgi:hypothetical protein
VLDDLARAPLAGQGVRAEVIFGEAFEAAGDFVEAVAVACDQFLSFFVGHGFSGAIGGRLVVGEDARARFLGSRAAEVNIIKGVLLKGRRRAAGAHGAARVGRGGMRGGHRRGVNVRERTIKGSGRAAVRELLACVCLLCSL